MSPPKEIVDWFRIFPFQYAITENYRRSTIAEQADPNTYGLALVDRVQSREFNNSVSVILIAANLGNEESRA